MNERNIPTLTPEEAAMPITWGNLQIIMDQVVKMIEDRQNTEIQGLDKILSAIADNMAKYFEESEYRRIRDLNYILLLLQSCNHLDQKVLLDNYGTWCQEYDKLNKKEN